MLYSWVTTHNYPTEVPVRFTSVLKKLVGVTQLYVRGLVMDRDDDLSVEVRPTWRQARCAGCGRRAPQYDHPRSVGRWQDLNWGPVRIYLVYRCRRVTCARCGGRPCNELVPWAAAGTKCTHRMEELTAFLARQTDRTSVTRVGLEFPVFLPNWSLERRCVRLRFDLRCPAMKDVLLTLLDLAVTVAKLCRPGGVRAVIAENLLLKQQLIVLRRPRQRAPNLTVCDRLLCGVGSLFLSQGRIRKIAIGVRPATLLTFHRALMRRKYRRLFSSSHRPRTPGPKGPSEALIRAIVELKSRNPRFGCPRIARVVSQTFGVDIDKNVVRRVLAKHYRPSPGGGGPSWLSFIGHTTDSLWSVDLFRCESIVLQSYWVLVVMDQFSRRIIGLGVHHGAVDGFSLCRMFNDAIRGRGVPRHLSTDHDPLFEVHHWQAHLRVLEIDEIKTVPHVPLSHPFVERLIGTIRREFLDHVLFWNGRDLERKLTDFQTYYNAARSHKSLAGNTPLGVAAGSTMARAELNHVRWVSHCRGLVQLPAAA